MFGSLFQSVSFVSPWILAGLLSLPALWWLLRIMPPAPRRIDFPALRLLLNLQTEEKTPNDAPWWLILLRLLAAAAVITAFAHPVLNPTNPLPGSGPLVLVVDDDWSSAGGWETRIETLTDLVDEAGRGGKLVYLLTTTSADGAPPADRGALRPTQAAAVLRTLQPKPWPAARGDVLPIVRNWQISGSANVFWASNGLSGPDYAALAEALQRLGSLTVLEPDPTDAAVALSSPEKGATDLVFRVRRGDASVDETIAFIARAQDGRALAREEIFFQAETAESQISIDLPTALRNELVRLEAETPRGAAAVSLVDERWRQRPVGLISESALDVGPALLSESYYVRRALEPVGQLSHGPLDILMRTEQAVIVAPDSARLSASDRESLSGWIEDGGVLVRFAGPRLADDGEDDLTPVRLRRGGRVLGGAMLWTEPLTLGGFSRASPFVGLTIPEDVRVLRQVLAEPSLDLDAKTWARLEDGTPLITAEERGSGWLVLVHTTANADWSDLALSGIFVELLARIVDLSNGIEPTEEGGATLMAPDQLLNGFGRLIAPQATARPITLDNMGSVTPSAFHPPGFYGDDTARRAFNLGDAVAGFEPAESHPPGVAPVPYAASEAIDLKPAFLTLAFLLLLVDGAVTLLMRGYGMPASWRRGATAGAVLVAIAVAAEPGPAAAQDADADIIAALGGTVLAYVVTGDEQTDRTSYAGLHGLSLVLNRRTAVEAADPIGVDIRRDELAFYPLLYWPVSNNQRPLDQGTVDKVNRFMANGGTILFDTRDQAGGGVGRDRFDTLRQIAAGLDIPRLDRVGPDHVMTKSFYLMQDFPGRWTGSPLWVETGGVASNDGVSRVIVGGNDWAAAWAVDDLGQPLFATVPGGERQREMAYRFGVNLVMYTLTGNYKADQVHVPAILERLGQ